MATGIGQTDPMSALVRPSSYHYVVDEPLLRTIAAEIQAAIPDSDLDLLATLPDEWLASLLP